MNYRRRGTGGVLKRRSGRPGRTPLFKLSEVIVGDEVRRRRAAHLPVSLQRVVALLKEEAKREIALMESRGANPGVLGRMQECKFSGRMINAFMFRQNLSIRKVSCIKLIPLEEAILLMRGFYKYLIFRILIDKDKYCARLLDPHFGRFLLQFRINKDEVPMRLGSSSKTIGSTTDRETHVRWLPGFGDRIATLIVAIDGTGYLLDIVIIFKGKGMRQEQYNNYPGIKVFYQDKAWINVQQETKWWRDVFLPYTKAFPAGSEWLMLHDGVRAHTARKSLCSTIMFLMLFFVADVLQYAKTHCNTLCLLPPPNLTNYWQTIDLNVGRFVRGFAYEKLEEVMVADLEAGVTKWPAEKKRLEVVKAVCAALRSGASQSTERHWQVHVPILG